MEVKRLHIYDLDALLHEKCDLEAFRYKKVAVFEGKKGVVIAEEEAVHKKASSLSDCVFIPANKPARPGTVRAAASYDVILTVSEIMAAPSEEMTMDTFFSRRNYNPRCQDNWRTLLSSLSDIGFDLNGFLPEKPSLKQMITSAEEHKPLSGGGSIQPPVQEL